MIAWLSFFIPAAPLGITHSWKGHLYHRDPYPAPSHPEHHLPTIPLQHSLQHHDLPRQRRLPVLDALLLLASLPPTPIPTRTIPNHKRRKHDRKRPSQSPPPLQYSLHF